MTQRTCPACHDPGFDEIGTKNDFRMLRCRACSSIYTDQLPTSETAEDYDSYYDEENLNIPSFVKQRIREIIQGFQPYYDKGTLLDIGFGAGDILSIAREEGWKEFGVEVSGTAVAHARKLDLNVQQGDLQEASYPDDFFDVVVASEIIEHCYEPEPFLKEVYRILRPGGLFWATTPAAGGLSYRIMGLKWSILSPPEHLQIFSRKAIRQMLSDAAFSNIKVRTHGFNPAEVSAHFRSQNNSQEDAGFDRVSAGYALNESLTKSGFKKRIKGALNGGLNLFRIGDSLKITATK